MLKKVGSRRRTALFLTLLGPLAGVAAYCTADANEQAWLEREFGDHLAKQATLLEARIGSCVEMLHCLAALYDTSGHVTREEFAAFALPALARHPEIHAVDWAPRIGAESRVAHVAQMRAQGLAGYEIRWRGADSRLAPAPTARHYFPVVYAEPAVGSDIVLGFDMLSEPRWRTALERAVATGLPQLTDPSRLDRLPDAGNGILVLLPVYGPASAADVGRQGQPLGIVLLVWRAEEFVAKTLLGDRGSEMLLDVRVDVQDTRDSSSWLPLLSAPLRRGTSPPGAPRAAVEWTLAGRPLRLSAAPPVEFSSKATRARPLLLGLLAFLLVGLLALGAWYRQASLRINRQKSSERLIRSLLRSLDQGVVVADLDGRIRLVNEAAERMVGGLSDVIARRVWTVVGVDRCAPDAPIERCADGGPLGRAVAGEHFADEEAYVSTPSASKGLWLRISGAPLRSARNEPLGGVVVFRDIAAKRAQEAQIRRLAAAVGQAADTIFVTDRDGRILDANKGFEATTGFSRAEALGKTPRILNSGIHDIEHFRRMWETILRGHVYRGTTINRRKDGSLWHGEQSVTPIRDTAGDVSHFVSVTKDITERMLLHKQEAEMRVAGLIQRRLYPAEVLDVQGMDIAFVTVPADITCGDYFDVIPRHDGTLIFAIGDVSGHGIGPALIMVETRAHLRSLLNAGHSIQRSLRLLNELLCDDLPDERFVSLLLVHYDPPTRRLSHVSAGHPDGFVVGGLGAPPHTMGPTGPALGLIRSSCYSIVEAPELSEGDILTLMTDGITEVRAPNGDLYDCDRVLQTVSARRDSTARDIADSLYASARDFAGGRKIEDDLTLLVCKAMPLDVRPAEDDVTRAAHAVAGDLRGVR
jgi:PAS domain S-box-containing protein